MSLRTCLSSTRVGKATKFGLMGDFSFSSHFDENERSISPNRSTWRAFIVSISFDILIDSCWKQRITNPEITQIDRVIIYIICYLSSLIVIDRSCMQRDMEKYGKVIRNRNRDRNRILLASKTFVVETKRTSKSLTRLSRYDIWLWFIVTSNYNIEHFDSILDHARLWQSK